MNDIKLIGRMTKEPELKKSTNGNSFVQFSMAVNRKFKTKDGKVEADFPPCIAYGKTAELICKYIRKGNKFLAEGELRTGSYQKDGQTVYTTTVNVNSIEFLESKGQPADSAEAVTPEIPSEDFREIDENVPF